ncbi:hypothetical protein EF834_01710 [Rhodococcus spongiicola]|uniref:Uncharacterized protein n=1 Tax=Rhodococcus spongiicola TaxID=2487352 RepID=A0A3S3AB79_9NOCA|nr:hypothetical protein EF834_01710 [Rhodococcus spongiicola]
MVSQVIGQHVVARIVQGLVLGQEVDLDAVGTVPALQVARVTLPVGRAEVVANHDAPGVGRNQPSLEHGAVEGRKEDILVIEANSVRTFEDRGSFGERQATGYHLGDLDSGGCCGVGHCGAPGTA